MITDEIDRALLELLGADGRLSYADLGKALALSPSQCLRRVRSLEQRGLITGYRAVIDRGALGYGLDIFVSVHLRLDDSSTITAFESAVGDVPEIIECHCLLGEPDYLLRVVARDLDGYQRLHTDVLGALPGIARLTSHVRVRAIKETAMPPS